MPGIDHPAAAASPAARALLERLGAIARVLSERDDALALLALGSVGLQTERLDEWSDLDFFVLVRDGAKARYIEQLDWLARAHPLAWHYRNTADGHKALTADGLFCEFAVFELHELPRIPYASGRFVWRRDEVPESIAAPSVPLPAPHGADWLLGEALSNLLVGLQRHARGERLSAMRLVQVQALDRVLELLEQGDGGAAASQCSRDPFSVERRAEQRVAGGAAVLGAWAPGYDATPQAALRLLEALQARVAVPAAVAARIRDLARCTPGTTPP